LNLNTNQVSQESFSDALLSLALGSGTSGNISVLGDLSFYQTNPFPQTQQDYYCVSTLDYRNWTQSYKNLTLPLQPSSYVGTNVFTIWLDNYFSSAVTNLYSAKWISNQDSYDVMQNYTPNPSEWAQINPNQFYKRPAYLFNSSLLTGSGINNTGDYLSAFTVAQFNGSNEQCMLNFSQNKDYGLFYSGNSLLFKDGASISTISGNLNTNQYYSVGFIRNSTSLTGYVNGQVSFTGAVSPSNLGSVKLSVGAAEGALPKYFGGNLGDVLVFSKNSSFDLDSNFHKPYNARFGILVP
jgi:hypothetical protein